MPREEAVGRRFAWFALMVLAWVAAEAAAAAFDLAPAAWRPYALLLPAGAAGVWILLLARWAGARPPLLAEAAAFAPLVATALLAPSNARHGLTWNAAAEAPGAWVAFGLAPFAAAAMVATVLVAAWEGARASREERWRFGLLAVAAGLALALAAWGLGERTPGSVDPWPGVLVALLPAGWVATTWRRPPGPPSDRFERAFDRLTDAHLLVDRFGRVEDLNPAAEALLEVRAPRARGHPLSRLAPGLRAEDAEDGTERVLQRSGGARRVWIERHPVDRGGVLVRLVDVTAQARTREGLQRRGLLLEATDALVRVPFDEEHPGAALEAALARIGAALGARSAALVRFEEDGDGGDGVRVRSLHAWSDPEVDGAGAAAMDAPSARLLRRGRSTWVRTSMREASAGGEAATRVSLPLQVHGEAWGALVVEGGAVGDFAQEAEDALRSVARSLASHVERRDAELARRRAERFQHELLALTRDLLRRQAPDAVYRSTVERAVESVPGAARGALWTRHEDGRYRPAARMEEGGTSGEAAGAWEGTRVEALLAGEASAVRTGLGAPATILAEVRVGEERTALLVLEAHPAGFDGEARARAEALAVQLGAILERLTLQERSHRQAEAYRALYGEARHSEERFRLLAENASDVVCLHAPDGRLQYVSPAAETVLGLDASVLSGQPPEAFVLVEDVRTLRRRVHLPLRAGHAVRDVRYRVQRRDGEVRWLESSAQAVRDDAGAVVNVVSTTRDVTERQRLEQRLVQGALYDELTGLPNRALLLDRLRHAMERTRRHGTAFALLFLDLDRFKLVNDSLGHGVGDTLLRSLAHRLAAAVREVDTVARLGGDEFCVLLEEVGGRDEALRTAERLQGALSEPFVVDDVDLFTSASIGVTFSDLGYDDPEMVLRDADTAMYAAKAAGKARYQVFEPSMHRGTVELLRLETQLHRAIDRGELRVLYQPIFDLRDGRLAGIEALVRWERPGYGLLTPDAFMPAAEASGLVVHLDLWVLQHACKQVASWRERYGATARVPLSVNLSAMHFALPDPVGALADAVEATALEPAGVHLELDEADVAARGEGFAEILDGLEERGLRVRLDDFGSGASALTDLRRLPVHALKLDRSFLAALHQDERNRRLVGALLRLAQDLELEVIAEGVEEAGEEEALRSLGCHFGQGYLWSPPIPADTFAQRYLAGVRAP